MNVLILQIGDNVTALDVSEEKSGEVALFIERVADTAHEPVKFASVEATPLSDWGPGDVADGLDLPTAGSAEEVPVSELAIQQPDA